MMISTTASFGMTSDEAAEVFRSMKVETTSKTPYSDATQVNRRRLPVIASVPTVKSGNEVSDAARAPL